MGEKRNAYAVLVGKPEEEEVIHKWILMKWSEMYTGVNRPGIRTWS
jgi:hypothetical protein